MRLIAKRFPITLVWAHCRHDFSTRRETGVGQFDFDILNGSGFDYSRPIPGGSQGAGNGVNNGVCADRIRSPREFR